MDMLHKKQRMEMTQNKLKIALELKRWQNGELKKILAEYNCHVL